MTYSFGSDGNEIASKDRCVDLDRGIWLIMVRSMWKKHCNVFDEHIYYVRNDFHNPFKMESSSIMNA